MNIKLKRKVQKFYEQIINFDRVAENNQEVLPNKSQQNSLFLWDASDNPAFFKSSPDTGWVNPVMTKAVYPAK